MHRTCPACSARLDQHTTSCPQCGTNLTAGGGNETTETGAADQEIRNTAVAAHLSTFAGLVVPFGSIIGPLAVWLTRRDRDPFIDQAGREALNFGISIAIYGLGAAGRSADAGRHPPADGRGDRLGGAGLAGRRQSQPGPGLPVPADHAAGPLSNQAQRARPSAAARTLGLPTIRGRSSQSAGLTQRVHPSPRRPAASPTPARPPCSSGLSPAQLPTQTPRLLFTRQRPIVRGVLALSSQLMGGSSSQCAPLRAE